MPFHLPFRSKPTEPAPSVARSWASSPDHHGRHPKDAPKPLARSDTLHSRYVQMLLGQDDIPALHNILASFFVWLLLAGFLVFPGTFTSIQHSLEGKEDSHAWTDQTTEKIFKSVKNIPLLVLAAIACGVSVVGMASLALRHLPNYVWLLNKLIVPGVANCLAGLISTSWVSTRSSTGIGASRPKSPPLSKDRVWALVSPSSSCLTGTSSSRSRKATGSTMKRGLATGA